MMKIGSSLLNIIIELGGVKIKSNPITRLVNSREEVRFQIGESLGSELELDQVHQMISTWKNKIEPDSRANELKEIKREIQGAVKKEFKKPLRKKINQKDK